METSTDDADDRPTGRDAVRSAILHAASRQFAASGLRASLRDIATDAGVNLGLIHRHFGKKDDLLRAVLAHHGRAGVQLVDGAPDLATATRRVFEEAGEGSSYLRIVAWLLLDDASVASYQDQFPTLALLRQRTSSDDMERDLLFAMAAFYGWAVFGDQLLAAFGRDPGERDLMTARLADAASRLLGQASPD